MGLSLRFQNWLGTARNSSGKIGEKKIHILLSPIFFWFECCPFHKEVFSHPHLARNIGKDALKPFPPAKVRDGVSQKKMKAIGGVLRKDSTFQTPFRFKMIYSLFFTVFLG